MAFGEERVAVELPGSSDGSVKRMTRGFFRRDPVLCARELVGCQIELNGCAGIIVETEAYAEEGDPACHTWKRQRARDFVAANPPGTAYVYLNYGMHWLMNFLVSGGERRGFVLLRALEPVEGIPRMTRRRRMKKTEHLCNGPAKLTQALGISGRHHGCDPFGDRDGGWLITEAATPVETLVSTRIGISQAADYPWRFVMKDSPWVSAPA